ncbi:MAG: triose-phosphate isomerase [Gammaproteobacteria bacterium]|nr:MAG: triose-phosphate isomerase [Gammaproteobacteria bacterium]
MRQPLVAGNWKMNGSRESIDELLNGILEGVSDVTNAEVAVCAPFVYLGQVSDRLDGTSVTWGSQTVNENDAGAYTGEVSGPMLKDFGCKYAIVGHSERRTIYGETDEQVADKFVAAQRHGFQPILCVGELLEEREQGVTNEVVSRQLDAVIAAAGIQAIANSVIAYEPVWAIGTGKTASPEQAQEVHAMIRAKLADLDADIAVSVRILYGGSMKPSNAKELIGMEDIDGGLIGGASLKAEDFLGICTAAN